MMLLIYFVCVLIYKLKLIIFTSKENPFLSIVRNKKERDEKGRKGKRGRLVFKSGIRK